MQQDPSFGEKHKGDMRTMGEWLGEYFDDAGYEGWIYYPELFKAMVMTAFPPIEALDDKAGSGWDDMRTFEQQQLNFLRVMDEHLVSASAKDPKNAAFANAVVS